MLLPAMLQNDFVELSVVPGTSIIRFVRNDRALQSLYDVNESMGAPERVLSQLHKPSHTLLVDLRAAPGRNDAEYERAVAAYRVAMLSGFRKVAIVVQSVTGQMQVQRHMREDGIGNARVFLDEMAAMAWLRSAREDGLQRGELTAGSVRTSFPAVSTPNSLTPRRNATHR
jgi:hypothetical protein